MEEGGDYLKEWVLGASLQWDTLSQPPCAFLWFRASTDEQLFLSCTSPKMLLLHRAENGGANLPRTEPRANIISPGLSCFSQGFVKVPF